MYKQTNNIGLVQYMCKISILEIILKQHVVKRNSLGTEAVLFSNECQKWTIILKIPNVLVILKVVNLFAENMKKI